MTTVYGIDKVMRALRHALEASHPDAVTKLEGEMESFLLSAQGTEAHAQPTFRKFVGTVRQVVKSNASRIAIANTAPDKGAVRVIVTKKGGAK